MSLQWLRTEAFRAQVKYMETEFLKQAMGVVASSPRFMDEVRTVLEGEGIQASEEQAAAIAALVHSGHYNVDFSNATHLRFINPRDVRRFANLLLAKRWEIVIWRSPTVRTHGFIVLEEPSYRLF